MSRSAVRALVAAMAMAVAVGTVSTAAFAHIEILPPAAPRGSLTVLSFVVPNESDTASTVQLELEFPAKPAISSVSVQPVPGWSSTIDTGASGNGDVIRRVTWTGGTVRPGEFQQFVIRASLPDTGKRVVFKALQTYDDGEVSRWIQRTVKGAPEPQYPAPTLRLEATEQGGHG